MIENASEISCKKSRYSSHMDIPTMISLNSSHHAENLSRLRLLFPFNPLEELSRALETSNDNYEFAVLLIQKQEKQKLKKASLKKIAEEMVVALTSVQSIETAVDIGQHFLEKSSVNSLKKNQLLQENNVLNNHIVELSKENKILKRAVHKLYEASGTSLEKDGTIEKLSKELEKERIKSYNLSLQLIQTVGGNYISPNRDLF